MGISGLSSNADIAIKNFAKGIRGQRDTQSSQISQIWRNLIISYEANYVQETRELYYHLKQISPKYKPTFLKTASPIEKDMGLAWRNVEYFEKLITNQMNLAWKELSENYFQLSNEEKLCRLQEFKRKCPGYQPSHFKDNLEPTLDEVSLYFDYNCSQDASYQALLSYIEYEHGYIELINFEAIFQALTEGDVLNDPYSQYLLLLRRNSRVPITFFQSRKLGAWVRQCFVDAEENNNLASVIRLTAFLAEFFELKSLKQMVLAQWQVFKNNQERYKLSKELFRDSNFFRDYLKPIFLEIILDETVTIRYWDRLFSKLIDHNIALEQFMEGSQCLIFLRASKKYSGFKIEVDTEKKIKLMNWLSTHLFLFEGIEMSSIDQLFILRAKDKRAETIAPFMGEKTRKVARFFWKQLCEQVNKIPELNTQALRKCFFNFFPFYKPLIKPSDSERVIKLWLEFYIYNLQSDLPANSSISLILSSSLNNFFKDTIYWRVKEKYHENFLLSALKIGREAVQALLKLDRLIKISPKQEKNG